MSKTTKLGEMLLEAGLIDKFQLESGLSFQRNVGGRIGSALVKLGYIAEETILQFLDEQDKFHRVELRDYMIPPDVLTALPISKLYESMVVPIEWETQGRSRTLVVAMTDPTNLKLIDDLQFMVGCRIKAVVAAESDIQASLDRHFPAGRPRSAQPAPQRRTLVEELSAISARKFDKPDKSARADKVDHAEDRLDRLIALLLRKGVLTDRDVDYLK